MKKVAYALLFTIAALGAGCADTTRTGVTSGDVADTVYTNGKIYTVNQAQPWAEAVAIKDGKFLVVGSNADVEAVIGDATEVVDLSGRMAMPGLADVHNHATGAAMGKANLYIQNPSDKDSILAEIREYAKANPDLPYIRGEAWNLGVFPDNSPNKEVLDELVPDRPAYFYSQTGHSAWVNSKALELVGIDEDTEQTSKFLWDVDPKTNEPSGTIREYAMAALEQKLAPVPAERMAPAIQETLALFSEWGFTTLKLAEGEPTWVEGANLLDEQGLLDVRLFPSWFFQAHQAAMTAEEAMDVVARWEEYKSPMVYPRYVKMFYDGSPDSYTSLLFDDYEGQPGNKGTTHFTTEEFTDFFTQFNSQGLGMIVHNFGDATGLELIKAFEGVRERNGDNGVPLHYSHAVMTRPEDFERLAKISGVCVDFLTLPYPHPAIEGTFKPPIGAERYQAFLNVRSAIDAGLPYSFGTDWPANLEQIPNGFFMMQGFITRRDPNNPDYGVLNEDQAITLEQAVWGFTRGAAECLGFDWPDRLGSIEEGKLADFIVIDRNIFEIPIEELKDTRVERTVVGGNIVHESN